MAQLNEHFVGRAFERLARNDGTYGKNVCLANPQLLADARNGQDRPDADQRVARTDNDTAGFADGFEHARGRVRRPDSFETDALDDGLGAPLYQIFLEVQLAFVRFDDGWHRVIRHRKNTRPHTERSSNQLHRLRESLPFREQRSEEHTSELQSLTNLVCRLLLEKKK